MKSISILLSIVFFSFALAAQTNRSVRPASGPAPVIQIGQYQSFTLKNGLKVFVVENKKRPKVSYFFQFDYDPILEGSKAGYVELAGQLLGTATTTRTKAQIDAEIDQIGADFSAWSSGIYASTLKKNNDKLLAVMADVVKNARFTQDELDKAKKQAISGLAATKNDPGGLSNFLKNAILFGKDHPYGELQSNSTFESVTTADVETFYKQNVLPGNSYLSIVGDISLAEAKKLAETWFGDWTKARATPRNWSKPAAPPATTVVIYDRPSSVQSVIKLTYPVEFNINAPDFFAAYVMNTLLGGGTYRLFDNLREKHGFTYGAYSSLSQDKLIGQFTAYAEVRNSVTDSAINEFLSEMKRIADEPVTAEELQRVKNDLTGGFALSLESPETVSRMAINTEKYKLPKDFYTNYLRRLDAVTIADVQAAARKYIKPANTYIFVVGKASEIESIVKPFGTLKYIDADGNYYDPRAEKAATSTIDPAAVIARYVEAMGGAGKIDQIKTLSLHFKATIQGMPITAEMYYQLPDRFAMAMLMSGNLLQKQVYNQGIGFVTSMQGRQELTGTELDQLKYEAMFLPEAKFAELGYKATVKAKEMLNGAETLVLEITNPSGKISTAWFDAVSGLKVKEESTQDSPMGAVTQVSEIKLYKEVNGIKVPSLISQSVGPQSFDLELVSVSVDEEIAPTVWE